MKTTTDDNGRYVFEGLANGSYIIEPTKNGYAFTPESRTVTITGSDVIDQDFEVQDVAPPTIVDRMPAPEAADVPISVSIEVTFSEPIDKSATENAFSIEPPVAGVKSFSTDGKTLIFDPDSYLSPSTIYTVKLSDSAKDLAGNVLDETTWSFNTVKGGRSVSIEPVSQEVHQGELFTMGIAVDDAAGIARAEINLTFDPNLLSISESDVKMTELTEEFDLIVNTEAAGKVAISMAKSAAALAGGSGKLVNVTLKVKDEVQEEIESALVLSSILLFDSTDNPILIARIENGTVKITSEYSFTINLYKGINLISVPLNPKTPWYLSDLANHTGSNVNMIIHYDTKTEKFVAYTPDSPDNVPVAGGAAYIVMMEAPAEVTFTGSTWDGIVALANGRNLMSIPLDCGEQWRISDLAAHIGSDVQMIISYDTGQRRFLAYLPNHPKTSLTNAPIAGGIGYVVFMKSAWDVVFTGKAWTNELPVAAPTTLAGSETPAITTPLLVVYGTVQRKDTTTPLNGVKVRVSNLRNKASAFGVSKSGRYTATLIDIPGNCAAQVGDILEITAIDNTGNLMMKTIHHTVTEDDVKVAMVNFGSLPMSPLPRENALLQNYPNPFNPDTWIPYELAEPATVIIRIYNLKGQLVCTLNLGRKEIGSYRSKEDAAYWNGRNNNGEPASSGVYFYQIQAGKFSATRKMLILK